MRSGEFEAIHIRTAIAPALIATQIFVRSVAYEVADALATRLISRAAKDGRIKKVAGTRRWEAS
jgi:hypothetical protein